MAPVVCSVNCTFGGKDSGSDPNLTFCILIILSANFHAYALKWSEKTLIDLTVYFSYLEWIPNIKVMTYVLFGSVVLKS